MMGEPVTKNDPRTTIRYLLCCLLWVATAFATASRAAPDTSPDSSFEDLLNRWNATLESGERILRQPSLGRQEIRLLLESIQVVRESALELRDRARLEYGRQQKLLNALGPAPGEGAPPEADDVAARRAAINHELARFDSQIKQSNVVLARVNDLLQRVAEVEYGTVARVLSQRSPSAFSPTILAQAMGQTPQRLDDLSRSASEWWSQKDFAQDRSARFTILILVLVVTFSAWWIGRYWILDRYGRKPGIDAPTSHQKFVATFMESAARIVLPVVAILLLRVIALSVIALDHDFRTITDRLTVAALQFVIITGLSAVTLAPHQSRWRITQFTDKAAVRLDRSLRILAGTGLLVHVIMAISGIDIREPLLVSRLSEAQAPNELSAVVSTVALLVIGVLLLKLLRPGNWRFVDTRDESNPERPPGLIFRTIFNLARLGLIVGMVVGVIGYLNFGLFVTKRIFWTLALLAIAWLIHGIVSMGIREATSDSNAFGSWVRRRVALDDTGSARLVFWIGLFADTLLVLSILVLSLLIWGMSWAELKPRFTNLIYGTKLGSFEFSLINIGIAVLVFVLLLIGVRMIQRLLSSRVLVQTNLDIGVRDALTSGVGYVGIVLAALITFSMLGLNLSELAIIFGALSVGIGFGLQHAVNNFVSGLILLIQRPIKAGDWIVVGGNEGYVKRINVIATEIQTFDNASLIVPNSNLVTAEVMNWMHRNSVGRVVIAVGVSYGSNPEQVRDLLLECADEHADVMRKPAPHVIFKDFGNSSLDFELRFYIRDIDQRLRIASEMRFAIKKTFDAAGIEIPFPQRDVHIRDIGNAADWAQTGTSAALSAEREKITRIRRPADSGAEGDGNEVQGGDRRERGT